MMQNWIRDRKNMFLRGNELGELLAAENREFDALNERVLRVGLSLDPDCAHKLRMGIRHRLLIELELSRHEKNQ
jgi:hypothetical protein